MEALSIDGTAKTPSLKFDGQEGVIEIKGRSIPENSIEFYKPRVEWLEQYSGSPMDLTQVNVQLEYFNTSSSKCILDVFKKLEAIHKGKSEVIINWYYEEDDDEMKETGEDYMELLDIDFKFIEIPE